QQNYNHFLFDIPHEEETGQLYLVTRGRCVGIFTSWLVALHSHTCKCILTNGTGIIHHPMSLVGSLATFSKVNALDEGIAHMMEAIDLKEACWVA
ncbi:hypothetical protein EV363DRAFT_1172483, partial [Boletus edulis]